MEICVHTFVANLIDSNSVVVDLGANIGSFTKRVYSTFGCFIYAVEPVPQFFLKIQADEKVKKFNYCIAGKTEPVLLNIPLDECASLYQQDDDKLNRSVITQGITFGHFLSGQNIRSVDLLKVDIEGAELDLFASLQVENLHMIKQVTIEFHDFLWPEMHEQVESLKRKLISGGFYCIPFSLNNGDVLFIRQELISHSAYLYLKCFLKYVRGLRRMIKRKLYH
jgi:FkbM family methyltransferase